MDAAPQDIFSSEEGAIIALSAIRNSTLPADIKAHLRDLFLSYTGEPDSAKRNIIRNDIVSVLLNNKDRLPPTLRPIIETVNGKANSLEEGSTAMGRKRPTPQFAQPSTKTEVKAEVAPEAPKPVPEVKPVAEPAPAVSAPTVDLRTRVDTIKHDINGRVGNPVNLINADEAVGREYMAAILDAMKNAGKGGDEASRVRLENAYKAALQVIEKMPKAAPVAVKEEPVAVPPEPVAPPVVEIKVEPRIVVEEKIPEVNPVPVSRQPRTEGLYHQPIDEVEAQEDNKPSGLSNLTTRLWNKNKEETPKVAETILPQNSVTATSPIRRLNVDSGIAAQSEAPPVAPPPPKAEPLHSLKDATTLDKDMDRLKEAAAERAEAEKRPIVGLDAPEVQAGLERLLSEWKLFRSSGWLGTGPSGINHPLYKQLQKLPMAAVVAGRFEGATPEIKQDLGDYMGGWRFEQGVVHEMGETFEHYLRRVIKQIIEKQRKVVAA